MKNKLIVNAFIITFLFSLGACSTRGSDKVSRSQKSNTVWVPQRSIVKPRSVVTKPTKIEQAQKVSTEKKPYKPQIHRYTDSKPQVRVLTAEEQAAFDKAMLQLEKKKREVSDPYASIPENSSSPILSNTDINTNASTTTKPKAQTRKSSSAVDSLMLQARAEMLVGKYLSAESKIERGLRIAPENPKLWALLAKAHFGQSNYSQSINMAKKAIQFSRDDDLTARSWRLIKKAGEKSGDTSAVKEANDYIKTNL